jgi:DnaK suppressor protein
MPKTSLPPEDLEGFRRLLLQIRRQLLGDVDHMETEALQSNRSDASGDLSLMPIHMADIGTDNYEREFTIGLIENETETLREIDAALQRIANRTYGVCEATHKPIGRARLKVVPWARYCVAYERSKESGANQRQQNPTPGARTPRAIPARRDSRSSQRRR